MPQCRNIPKRNPSNRLRAARFSAVGTYFSGTLEVVSNRLFLSCCWPFVCAKMGVVNAMPNNDVVIILFISISYDCANILKMFEMRAMIMSLYALQYDFKMY